MSELEAILETRKNFYAFLYRWYVEEPARELAEDLVNGKFQFQEFAALELNADLSESFRLLKEYMKKSKGEGAATVYENLMKEFTILFVGPFRLPVQPYEAWWVTGKLGGELLAKLKGEYWNADISKSQEFIETEDHIGFELKFMHYLCEETLAADTEKRRRECLKLQRNFFDEHILKWIPIFCDALYYYEASDFYKGIAKLTKGFIMLDDAVLTDLLDSL